RRYTVGHGTGQRTIAVESAGADEMRLICDGRSIGVQAFVDGRQIHVWSQGVDASFEVAEPEGADPVDAALAGALATPLPGTVVAVEVKVGDQVIAGQPLIVVEAMKMEHTIRAPRAGTIAAIRCRVGERVAEGVSLADLSEP
ncbi:MAG: acetyl-CoA carboxylase biotin carboxyl carrier protein subunit, partial [Steroidobacteraceae bacterium]